MQHIDLAVWILTGTQEREPGNREQLVFHQSGDICSIGQSVAGRAPPSGADNKHPTTMVVLAEYMEYSKSEHLVYGHIRARREPGR